MLEEKEKQSLKPKRVVVKRPVKVVAKSGGLKNEENNSEIMLNEQIDLNDNFFSDNEQNMISEKADKDKTKKRRGRPPKTEKQEEEKADKEDSEGLFYQNDELKTTDVSKLNFENNKISKTEEIFGTYGFALTQDDEKEESGPKRRYGRKKNNEKDVTDVSNDSLNQYLFTNDQDNSEKETASDNKDFTGDLGLKEKKSAKSVEEAENNQGKAKNKKREKISKKDFSQKEFSKKNAKTDQNKKDVSEAVKTVKDKTVREKNSRDKSIREKYFKDSSFKDIKENKDYSKENKEKKDNASREDSFKDLYYREDENKEDGLYNNPDFQNNSEDRYGSDFDNKLNDRDSFYNKSFRKGQKNSVQKKAYTMEDVAVSAEEYALHVQTRIVVHEISAMPTHNLKVKLSQMTGCTVDDLAEYKKQEIVTEIIRSHIQAGGVVYTIGTLEVLSEGYGFLRSPFNSYLSGPEDVYVPAGVIKYLNLKTGDTVEGPIKDPKDVDKFFAINKIAFVNGEEPIVAKTRVPFDSLVPLYPDSRINLETERADNDVSMRIINLFCPIGKGQRALITAPPRTGKTILLQQIANAITTNHPEIHLIVLLVDERPEEVTDMRRNVKGEVIASTFDEQATRHVNVAEMVIEKAKRLVEHKKDVVILLDSITRLARAYNQTVPASGKILSGGVDSNALHKPKRFFGAARNIENGGSLTIIASALIETGSRMDEVIFEEFKGTGNSEIVLDRMMSERRLFPAINLKKSGTRREDLLLSEDEAQKIWILRNNILNRLEDFDITSFLVDKMKKTKNNEAFLRSMNTGVGPAV